MHGDRKFEIALPSRELAKVCNGILIFTSIEDIGIIVAFVVAFIFVVLLKVLCLNVHAFVGGCGQDRVIT